MDQMDYSEPLDQDEEINFRRWLRSLDRQPVEVAQDDQWNQVAIETTVDYVFGLSA